MGNSRKTMLDFSQFEALTFDCYGTLIDWETGLLKALRPMAERRGVNAGDRELLEAYSAAESKAESGSFKPYMEVLEEVVRELG